MTEVGGNHVKIVLDVYL